MTLAVVRVQPEGLTVVPVGNSEALVPGQGVLAIGSMAFAVGADDFRNSITGRDQRINRR
jgi:S1-C subfamily serine protease